MNSFIFGQVLKGHPQCGPCALLLCWGQGCHRALVSQVGPQTGWEAQPRCRGGRGSQQSKLTGANRLDGEFVKGTWCHQLCKVAWDHIHSPCQGLSPSAVFQLVPASTVDTVRLIGGSLSPTVHVLFILLGFLLVLGSSQTLHEHFTSRLSVPCSSIVFLGVFPIGFQNHVFWGLISTLKDLSSLLREKIMALWCLLTVDCRRKGVSFW